MDDQHRGDLVVEEDSWDSSGSVGGSVTLSVLLPLVVRGEVSFVGSHGVLERRKEGRTAKPDG